MRWVGRLGCGHDVGGDGRVPEVETEYLVCDVCTVDGGAGARWYPLVSVITAEPERGPDGRAW